MAVSRWLALAMLVQVHIVASAQTADVPDSWGGDFGARPRLTGSWGGSRDELGRKGLTLDVDLLLTPQAVLSGGRSTGSAVWGNLDYALNLDTHKAGLWPGGFVRIEGMSGFGTSVLEESGALIAVNTAATLPATSEHTTALTNATLTQFFGDQLSVMLGKINTLDLGETEFYGNYHTQFLNTALLAPMTLEQVPVSAWGAGVFVQPRADLQLSVFILNPSGTPTTNPVFGDGIEIQPNVQWTIRPFGLVGHQGLAATWDDRQRYSLEQEPANLVHLLLLQKFPRLVNPGPALTAILEQYFPQLLQPAGPLNTKSSTWALGYTFDQYLWQPQGQPEHGIGLFFAAGISDGNPNPLQYSLVVGIGGKGVIAGRAADSLGIGFASTEFSSEFVPYLRERLPLGLERENALEIYYNATVTGWLGLSADLQLVSPGLSKTLTGTALTNVDTAVVAGLRLYARF
jgi:porin